MIYENLVLTNDQGYYLLSRVDLEDGKFSLQNKNWFDNFLKGDYKDNPYFNEVNRLINGKVETVYTFNYYRLLSWKAGGRMTIFLQEDISTINPTGLFEPFVKDAKLGRIAKRESTAYILPGFKDFSDLDDVTKDELTEILSVLEQFEKVYLPETEKGKPSLSYKYESISDLIISEIFFGQDLSIIKSLLDDLNPTQDQLSDLSYSRQKLFFHTFHELLKGYTGTNKLINDYKKFTFDNIAFEDLTFEDIHSVEFTSAEFKVAELQLRLLPKLFGSRFYAALQVGIISLYKEGGSVKIRPLAFHYCILQDIMNGRRIKNINARSFTPYSTQDPQEMLRVLACCLTFGQVISFNVEGKGSRVLDLKGDESFVSALINEKEFRSPSNPAKYSSHYGALLSEFLGKYSGIHQEDYSIRKNIVGKMAIMEGFANLLQFIMSPAIIELVGNDFNIDAFKDNPNIWSKKNINYAFNQIFEKLIIPAARSGSTVDIRDVTDTLLKVFTGKEEVATHKITSGNIRGATAAFWQSDNYGKIALDYAILSQFFGKNFHKIQPALFYTYYNLENHPQALSVEQLLTPEFREKVDHLYNNFYKILSEKYSNGQILTAFFHKEDALGLHKGTTLREIFSGNLAKFTELRGGTMLEIKLQKNDQTGEIINADEFNEFIASIVFYLIKFNSIVFIKEGWQKGKANFGLFASQREIFDSDYMASDVNLASTVNQLSASVVLSVLGQQILQEYQSTWNIKDGKTIWKYEDCWPIYLFTDHSNLRRWFSNHFKCDIKDLTSR